MSTPRHIVAILGMPGSGKTEAIEYLEATYKFSKVYFGQVTFEEMKRRGLEQNQVNERSVREELRARRGKDYYANEMIKLIDAVLQSELVLVESLYSWTEYQTFERNYGHTFSTVAIHASPTTRHKRLTTRPVRPLTNSEAEIRDVAQIEQLEQGGPIAMADHVVVNEGPVEEMQRALDAIIAKIKK